MSTFQKFIQYYKPYKKVFIFDLICAAFISLVDLAYPQILRSLTKTLFLKDASMILKTLPIIGGILFICYIFQAFCKYYVSCQGHIMGAQMERDMRRKLFDHYENLSFSYYDQHNTGQMMSRLVSDLFDISEAAHHGPENLFISLVKIVGSFIFLFIIQWKLAIILLAIVLLMIFFSAKQNRKMQATFLDNRRKIGDVNASLQDSLAGIRIVQSFANEDIEREKFRVGNEAFLDSKRDNYRAMGSFQSGNTFFQGMMYLVTLLAGGYFIALGQMSAADLAMYALYIGIFISPIQILVELTEMIQKGMSGFIRYQSVIDIEPEITDSVDAVNMKHPDGDICYHDVSFSYEDNEIVLNHIDFNIKSGKSIALVGPSGGGKTTICSLLPRFYDITDGSITIGGQNIKDIKLESLRSSIGIVQQDVYLFGGSIKENIAYGNPDATFDEIVEAAKKANIAQDPAVKALIAERKTEIYSAELVRKNAAAHPLTDADLKKTYEEVKKQYDPNEIKVRHILVKTEQEAKDIIKSLNAGGDFAAIAKEKSLDQGTAAQGGEIPFTNIRRIAIPGFAETAMALNKGSLLPVPFHSALGYHVIQLQDKREVPLPSFDALKPQIQNLAAQRQAQQYMADLMRNAKIAEAAPAKKKSSK